MTRIRVAGAGISGLAAAWNLVTLGARVEVFETSNRPGGLIQTHHTPEGMVETAANAILATPAVLALFNALGVEPLFPRPESKRRYIFRDGRARRWPLSPFETAMTAAAIARSWATGTRAAREHESVTDWGCRAFGTAATRQLIEPALQGIYAAPGHTLSAAAIGLGRRGRRPPLVAPRGGMQELTARLHDALVRSGVLFHFNAPCPAPRSDAPAVVCTNVSGAAAVAASAGLCRLAEVLASVGTVSLTTATCFYEPCAEDLHGFGVLFPRGTAAALGVLFNTDIFEGRSALRSETWIYRGEDVRDRNDAMLMAQIGSDRALLTKRAVDPIAGRITRVSRALPLYDRRILDVHREAARTPAWIQLCGNYLGAAGIAALIERAAVCAERILRN
jgi:protoporphyrinogen/coproporphyrinogen III oxidase